MSKVSLKNVSIPFSKDSFWLKDINLTIKDGELFVFLGPPASGNRSLLWLIAGVNPDFFTDADWRSRLCKFLFFPLDIIMGSVPISDGEIRIDDSLVNGISLNKRNLILISANCRLYPKINSWFKPRFQRDKETGMMRVREAARFLGIEHLLTENPKNLSLLEQRLLLLVQGMFWDPKVVLLEETFSDTCIDKNELITWGKKIHDLQRMFKKTFIYMTHESQEAMFLADRVALIDRTILEVVPALQLREALLRLRDSEKCAHRIKWFYSAYNQLKDS